jgi:hypothetical protein
LGRRQGELKYGPEPHHLAPVGVDDGQADRQPHPTPLVFCGEEVLEDPFEVSRINARPSIAHFDEHSAVRLALPNPDG